MVGGIALGGLWLCGCVLQVLSLLRGVVHESLRGARMMPMMCNQSGTENLQRGVLERGLFGKALIFGSISSDCTYTLVVVVL